MSDLEARVEELESELEAASDVFVQVRNGDGDVVPLDVILDALGAQK